MDIKQELLALLDDILRLGGRTSDFAMDTPLLGAVPELDSMAVVALIAAMEDYFGFQVDDEDIDGATFATVGALAGFVDEKLARLAG